MRKLIIEPTPKTPKVLLDPTSYTFVIQGRSIPEDSVGFYRKVNLWVDEVGPELSGTVEFEFRLEYFNTSSSKCLLDLFKQIQGLWEKNNKVVIKWFCSEDDPDMAETGADYAALLKVPFEIIVLEEA